jgi:hypothetical protein
MGSFEAACAALPRHTVSSTWVPIQSACPHWLPDGARVIRARTRCLRLIYINGWVAHAQPATGSPTASVLVCFMLSFWGRGGFTQCDTVNAAGQARCATQACACMAGSWFNCCVGRVPVAVPACVLRTAISCGCDDCLPAVLGLRGAGFSALLLLCFRL